jgi:proteasome alpha subunit
MSMPFYVPPEQLVKDRADFAKRGIARGRSMVALEFDTGVLLIGENPNGSLHKLGEIYDQIAFAGVGRFNEFETLRVAGIRYADLKGYSYGRSDVTAKGLANAYSQTLGQIFSHEVKPYEVEVIVAEVGSQREDTQLYRIQFDGTLLSERGWAAIGGKDEELADKLEDGFTDDLDMTGAISTAASAIEAVEEREIAAADWEAAILDRSAERRLFRRLSAGEIESARAA